MWPDNYGQTEEMYDRHLLQYGVMFPAGRLTENVARAERLGLSKFGELSSLVYALKQPQAPDAGLTARIVTLLLQAGALHEGENIDRRYALLLETFMASPVTVSSELEPLFQYWLELLNGQHPEGLENPEYVWRGQGMQGQFKAMLAGISVHGSVRMMGTFWRLLHSRWAAYIMMLTTERTLLTSQRLPLPLFARFSLPAGNQEDPDISVLQILWSQNRRVFLEQAREQFSELADLPFEMLVDTLATQPVPEEWLEDVVPLTDVVWVAPYVRVEEVTSADVTV